VPINNKRNQLQQRVDKRVDDESILRERRQPKKKKRFVTRLSPVKDFQLSKINKGIDHDDARAIGRLTPNINKERSSSGSAPRSALPSTTPSSTTSPAHTPPLANTEVCIHLTKSPRTETYKIF
jgi:hypothetical protein